MSIHWNEHDPRNTRNGRKCNKWVGKRADGKFFLVHYVPSMGFLCRAASGRIIGTGSSLDVAKGMALED